MKDQRTPVQALEDLESLSAKLSSVFHAQVGQLGLRAISLSWLLGVCLFVLNGLWYSCRGVSLFRFVFAGQSTSGSSYSETDNAKIVMPNCHIRHQLIRLQQWTLSLAIYFGIETKFVWLHPNTLSAQVALSLVQFIGMKCLWQCYFSIVANCSLAIVRHWTRQLPLAWVSSDLWSQF